MLFLRNIADLWSCFPHPLVPATRNGRTAVTQTNVWPIQTAAYTPSGVLVLAGSLANCPPGEWFNKDTGKTILAVGMARWLLLPLVTSGVASQSKLSFS